MPLSNAAPRKKLHTRSIELNGYQREDNLWDIEAHLTDIKTYPIKNQYRDGIEPGEAVHEMWVRITLDDSYTIVDAEAVTDNSPFETCPSITSVYKELIGIRIGVGWRRALNEKVKGRLGCTHINELMGPIATVAFQTMIGPLQRKKAKKDHAELFKPMIINSCHAWADDGNVVKTHFPEFYKGKEAD